MIYHHPCSCSGTDSRCPLHTGLRAMAPIKKRKNVFMLKRSGIDLNDLIMDADSDDTVKSLRKRFEHTTGIQYLVILDLLEQAGLWDGEE